ncbi:MAG: DNA repair protein RecO [Limisphaerales bacterium]
MIERATGIILRTRLLTETSLIIQWLARDFGRLSTVAKGACRPKSPFRGKLDLFYLADFSFHRSRRSELHLLREVMVRETHTALREELGYLQQAAYGAALIEQTTETETPIPVLFDLLLALLEHLSRQPPQPLTVFAFEIKLLLELGLKPDFAAVRLSAGARQILEKLIDAQWAMLGRLKPSGAQVAEIDRFLRGFLVFHVGKVPVGREAALAL